MDRVSSKSLLDNVTMVSQSTYLFDEAIEDSILAEQEQSAPAPETAPAPEAPAEPAPAEAPAEEAPAQPAADEEAEKKE